MKLIDQIRHLSPCPPAVEWLGDRDLATAWAECPNGAWMLWLYERSANYDKRLAVLVGGLIANDVRHLMIDPRSTAAVDTCLAYGGGWASDDQLDAVWAASRDAWAAARAAEAAVWAASRDAAWAYAEADARAAAEAAAWAAEAESGAAYAAALQRYADICREVLPVPIINPPQGQAGDEG